MLDEPAETIIVTLGVPTNATVASGKGTATGTITDDDATPTATLELSSAAISENGGTSTITASLSGATSEVVTLTIAATPVDPAVAGDMTLSATKTLTIAAGATTSTGTVIITAVDNKVDAPNKSVTVSATAEGGNGVANPDDVTLTITDDDEPVSFAIAGAEATEGGKVAFIVTRSGAEGNVASVKIKTAAATSDGAKPAATDDYTAITTARTLNFAKGVTSHTVEVQTTQDDLFEPDETFLASLSAPALAEGDPGTGISIATDKGTATGTIKNDDIQPSFAVADASAAEGEAMTFTVTRSGARDNAVSVKWNTKAATGNGAASSSDYTEQTTATKLDFAKGVVTQTFTVATTEDNLFEGNETFLVELTEAEGGTITTAEATGTITDDDAAPTGITLSVDTNGATSGTPSTVAEDAGPTGVIVTATVNGTTRYVDAKTIAVSVVDNTAASPADYAEVSSFNITIAAGAASQTGSFTLTPVDDALDEVNETIAVTGTLHTITITGASITITDDDIRGITVVGSSLAMAEVDNSETDKHENQASYTIVLTSQPTDDVRIDLTVPSIVTVNPTALTFTPSNWNVAQTVTVTAVNDDKDNASDVRTGTITHQVVAGSSDYGDQTATSVSVTVNDDDGDPSLSIDAPSVAEGDDGTATLTFTITLAPVSGKAVRVHYADAGTGTATSGEDYAAITAGTLNFAAGETEKTVDVTINGDSLNEPNETVILRLSAVSNAALTGGKTTLDGTGTINDDDAAPTVSVANASAVTEGNDSKATTNMSFTVSLSAASGQAVTVPYTLSGTATATDDYTDPATKSIKIAAGTRSGTIVIPVKGDTVDEPDETIIVTLGVPTNASIATTEGAGTATGTINDDDATPTATLELSSAAISENGGTSTITASLSGATSAAVTLTVAAPPGATTLSATKTLTIAAGATTSTGTVIITAVDNKVDAPNKSVAISATATGGNGVADPDDVTLTITDDDEAPTELNIKVSLAKDKTSSKVAENVQTPPTITVTASLAGEVTSSTVQTVTVTVGDEDDSATVVADYKAVDKFDITIPAESSSGTGSFTFTPVNDAVDEDDETVSINGALADDDPVALASITITDDDTRGITVAPVALTLAEVDDPLTQNKTEHQKTYTVELDSAPTGTVTVNLASSDTTIATLSGNSLEFSASDWDAQTVTVTAVADDIDNADDERTVRITHRVSAAATDYADETAAPVAVTVTDDEGAPILSIDAPSVAEGDDGTATLTFKVALAPVSGKAVRVHYADAGTGTATSATDYAAITAGTLNFAAGDTEKTVDVTINGDSLDELDETVILRLSAASNASLDGGGQTLDGTGTITDDDAAPTVSVANASAVTEGNDSKATTNMSFTVSLSAASGQAVTVPYTLSGTATATDDYTDPATKEVEIAAGASSGTIVIPVKGDTVDEPDETIIVTLGAPTNASIATTEGAGTATGTINDDDAAPTVSVANASAVNEGNDPKITTNMSFTVSLSAASGQAVTVPYTLSGTATATDDYTDPATKEVEIAAGASSATIVIPVKGDVLDEPAETIIVTLGVPTNASIATTEGAGTATGTITDDDATPTATLELSSAAISENGGTSTITASLSGATSEVVTLTIAATPVDPAVAGDMTLSATKTLTIAAGATTSTGTVIITAVDNKVDAPNKSVTVSATAEGGNGVANPDDVTLTITDDDEPVSFAIAGAEATEGGKVAFIVTRSGAEGNVASVKIKTAAATSDGAKPAATDDYTAITTARTLNFAKGVTSHTVEVQTTQDDLFEPDETFLASLSAPALAEGDPGTGISIATDKGTATGTIKNDDIQPSFAVADASAAEGEAMTFTVTRSGARDNAVSVKWNTKAATGNGAASSSDYTEQTTATKLDFAKGVVTQTFTVATTEDNLFEGNETFLVELTEAEGGTITTAEATGTITDDDAAPTGITLSVDTNGATSGTPSTVAEDAGPTGVIVTATVNGTTRYVDAKTIAVSVVDNTAASPADYAEVSSFNITIAAGAASQTGSFTLTPVDDALDEVNETIAVTGTLHTITITGASITITDDDIRGITVVGSSLAMAEVDNSETDKHENQASYTIVLTSQPTDDVRIDLTVPSIVTVNPTALTFTPSNWNVAQTVTVTAVNDDKDNASDVRTGTITHQVVAGSSDYGDQTATSVSVTVNDDDGDPSLSIDAPSVAEGDDGTATLTFTITLAPVSGKAVRVHYADAGTGTATSGEDYAAITAGTLNFAAGETEKTVDVTINGDSLNEPNETVILRLSAVSNAALTGGKTTLDGTGTINDDDAAPTVSVANASAVTEGNDSKATTNMSFTVSLSAASGQAVTVPYTLSGTATATDDYTDPATKSIKIAAGTRSGTIVIPVKGDTVDEPDETIIVTLGVPTNASIATTEGAGTATGTINDDDATPTATLELSSAAISENGGTSTITASLSGATSAAVTLTVAAPPGATTLSATKTLTIAAGATTSTGTVIITAVDNKVDAPNKSVAISATATGGNGVADPDDVTLTITDDDEAPTELNIKVSLAKDKTSSKVAENVQTPPTITVTASLAGEVTSSTVQTVTVTVGDEDDSATVVADYKAVDKFDITIPAESSSGTGSFTFTPVNDAVDEDDETVSINGALADDDPVALASITITDDDTRGITVAPVALTLAEVDDPLTQNKTEHQKTYTVELDSAPTGTVTVNLASSDTTIATLSGNSLEFSASDWDAQTVTVTAVADDIDNADDERTVRITHRVSAAATDYADETAAPVAVTVTDDEGAPILSIDAPSVAEGDDGTATLTFKVALAPVSGKAVRVHYADAGTGTATSATDYAAITAGTLNFAAGDTEKTVDVTINGDSLDELDETVILRLSAASNASLDGGGQTLDGTGTITDDDAAPTVSVANASAVTEGNDSKATTNMSFTVSLSAASGQAVTVPYTLSGTATATDDYTDPATKEVEIAAGASSGTIVIPVKGDTVDEPDETIIVTLGAPTNASIATTEGAGTATGTINDDDAAPTVSVANASAVNEGNDPKITTNMSFTVSLSAASGQAVTVPYTLSGTATATDDYTDPATKEVEIAAGTRSAAINIPVKGDVLDEPAETIIVTLGVPTNATVASGKGTATGTITDDDATPTATLELSSAAISENGGTSTITASLSGATSEVVTLTIAATPVDPAVAGDMTLSATKTLTIAAGATTSTGTVIITAVDNKVDAPNKSVTVSATAEGGNGVANPDDVTLTITDDDEPVSFAIAGAEATEGGKVAFIVTRSGAEGNVASVKIKTAAATSDGAKPAATDDYTAITTARTLNFAKGVTSHTVEVQTTQDDLFEPDETFLASLSAPALAEGDPGTGISIATDKGTATGTIKNDDIQPSFAVADASAAEGEAMTFTVTRSGARDNAVSVKWNTKAATGNGAASSSDYTEQTTATKLDFAKGVVTQTFTVATTEDNLFEGNETFLVELTEAEGGTITTAEATGTITDDDAAPTGITLSVDTNGATSGTPSTVAEDAGPTGVIVTATVNGTTRYVDAKTIAVSVVDNTAASPADYAEVSSFNITIAAGAASQTGSFTLTPVDDALDEVNETIAVTGTLHTITITGASITITDDDIRGITVVGSSLAMAEVDNSETDKHENQASYTIVLTSQPTDDVRIDLTVPSIVTVNPTALTFTPSNWNVAQTVTVTAVNDDKDNASDVRTGTITHQVVAGSSDYGDQTATSVSVTVNDDDGDPSLSIDAPSVAEGDDGTATLTFTITLAPVSGKAVRVHYADAGTGTATSGEDYAAITAGTLNFAAGETEKTVDVTINGDSLNEPNETVILRLSAVSNAALTGGKTTLDGTGTINDDDAAPTVSVANASAVTEGNDSKATTNMSFTVSLSAASGQAVTVPYTLSGTATATDDYTDPATKSIKIAAGTRSGTIVIPVKGDTVDEPDETIIVTLGVPTNASIATTEGAGTATGTINDDDATPTATLELSSAAISENGGTSTITASLSGATSEAVTLTVAAPPGATTLSATKTLTIAAGTTTSTGTVIITAVDNKVDAPNKSVAISATATGGNGVADPDDVTLTITDDDTRGITVAPVALTLAEVDDPSTQNKTEHQKTYTVELASEPTGTVTVNLASSDTTIATLSGNSLEFTASDWNVAQTVTVTAVADDIDNSANKRTVRITHTVSAAATDYADETAAPVAVTVTDDDGAPTLSIDAPSVAEGDDGTATLTFKVTLAPASGNPVSVHYADAGTGTATSATDYAAITAGTLTFAAGDTEKTITVTVNGDTLDEDNETVILRLSSASNAALTGGKTTLDGTGTITDDDAAPTVSVANASAVTEGNDSKATTNMSFTVSLSATSSQVITVPYTLSGTATATDDYTDPATKSIKIAAGASSGTIVIPVKGDTVDEPDETIIVTLGAPTNASIATTEGAGTATGTINDDDAAPTVSVANATAVNEGNDPKTTVNMSFTVTLAAASGQAITVPYTLTGTATGGSDYETPASTSLSIAAGASSGTIVIPVKGDTVDEPDETIIVTLGVPTNASIATTEGAGTATGTINDDDATPTATLELSSAAISENGGTSTITASLSGATSAAVTLTVAAPPGATTLSATKTLTIAAGATTSTGTVIITAVDNKVDAPNKSVAISATATGGNGVADPDDVTLTITDDDTRGITVAPVALTLAEVDDPSTQNKTEHQKTYTVELASEPTGTVTVNLASSDTTIATLSGNSLEFTASDWNVAQTVTVTAVADDIDNSANKRTVRITHTVSAAATDYADETAAPVAVTVTDDDGAPTLSIDAPSVAEGDDGTATLTFKVTLAPASGNPVSVHYADAGTGTATSATDYAAITAGTLTFAAGDTEKTITVTVNGDTLDEDNETVILRLSSASNAALTGGKTTLDGTGTITDDDAAPTVSVANASAVTEGNDSKATTNMSFTVSLSATSSQVITVPYTLSGTATATDDYTDPATKSIKIAAGASSGTIVIPVKGDTVDEPDETIIVTLGAPTNASIATTEGAGTATGTINDDDAAPTVSVANATAVNEGNDPKTTVNMSFTVTLAAASGQAITVPYTLTGTATGGSDYETPASTSLSIAAGASSGTIVIPVKGDTVDEPDETIIVTLGVPTNASIATTEGAGTATGTINDDDATPTATLELSSAAISENGGTSTITASLSGATSAAVTLTVAAPPGATTLSATKTLTIAAGATTSTGTVIITAVDNKVDAPNKSVAISATATGGNGVADPDDVTLTITDDDEAPTELNIKVSLAKDKTSSKVAENVQTPPTITVTASLAGEVTSSTVQTVTVTVGDEDDSATVVADYKAVDKFDITIPAESSSGTGSFTFTPVNDAVDEDDETVSINGALADDDPVALASITITDDDTRGITVAPVALTLAEVDDPLTQNKTEHQKTYTVELDSAPTGTVTVNLASSDTTIATLSGNSLEFSASDWDAQTVTVTAVADDIDNADDERTVRITHRVSAAATDYADETAAPVAVTVTDDEGAPILSIDAPSVAEGDDGTATLTFKVALAPVSGKAVRVHYADAGTGTATSATDYAAITAGTLNFAAGDTEKTVDVTINGDSLDELDETVILRLSAASNASLDGGGQTLDGTGTINDDDAAPTVSVANASAVTEGNDSKATTNMSFTVSLSAASGQAVTVPYTLSGTATATDDYTDPATKEVEIAAGASSGTIVIPVKGDTVDEPDETIIVTLGAPTNASIATTEGAGTATGTINDDDAAPTVSVANASAVNEGNDPKITTNMSFTVSLSAASGQAVTVPYTLSGTATATDDYTDPATKEVEIAAGASSATIVIPVKGDVLDEPAETIIVTLGVPTNATVASGKGTATGTITDDDATPTATLELSSAAISENGGTSTITASLSGATSEVVTLTIAATPVDPAVAGDMTLSATKTLTIAAGATTSTGTVIITAVDNKVDAPNKSVTVSATAEGGNGVANPDDVTLTITDDDEPVSFAIAGAEATEGGKVAFIVTRSGAEGNVASVKIKTAAATSDGAKPAATDDYTAITTARTLNFAKGVTSHTVEVQTTQDDLFEPDETFLASLSAPALAEGDPGTGISIATDKGTATGTIKNDDIQPSFAVADASAAEGEAMTFTVTRSGARDNAVSVKWNTKAATGNGAASSSDYTEQTTATKLDFAKGVVTQTFTVATTEDNLFEGNETFLVELTEAEGGTITTAEATGTITDDDAAPTGITLSVDTNGATSGTPSTVAEDAGPTGVIVTATVNGTTRYVDAKTIAVSVVDNTAASPADYAEVSSFNITIAAGAASQTGSFTLTPVDDALDEVNETIAVTGTLHTITITGASITITDDDTRGITVAPVALTLAEVDDPSTQNKTEHQKTYTVELASEPTGTVTVNLASSDTTIATLSGNSLEFTASDWNVAQTVTVTAVADDIDNSANKRTVRITHTVSAAATDYADETAAPVAVTVTDDDGAPTLSIDAPSVAEGDDGTATLTFKVTLAPASGNPVSVHYADAGTGTATSATDYAAITAGTLTFAAGDTEKTITVTVNGDTLDEDNETVILRLSSASNAALTGGKTTLDGTGTITDDDAAPTATLALSPTSISENVETTTVSATLSGPSIQDVTLSIATTPVDPAVAGDFTLSSNKVLTIAAGTTTSTGSVTITTVDNDDVAADKSVIVSATASGGGVTNPADVVLTITDDDEIAPPSKSIVTLELSSNVISENAETTTVTATLSGASSEAVTLTIAATPVDPAVAGDIALSTNKTLTIAAGDTTSTGTVTITAVNNDVNAPNKSVTVAAIVNSGGLSNPAPVTLTITDDDELGININPVTLTLAEIDDPSTQSITEHQQTYTVELDSEPTGTVTVNLASGDTKIATLSDNSLEFTASDWDAQTVTVTAVKDDIDNPGDARTVRITHTVSATGTNYEDEAAITVNVTVTDDDGTPTLSIDAPSIVEGDNGTTTMTFIVNLLPASGKPVSVNYADADTGTATSATDYAAITAGTLNFAAGDTEKTITVTVNGDTLDEDNETVILRLSAASNADLDGGGQTLDGTGTITDDDEVPTVSLALSPTSISENGGTSTVTAILSGPTSQDVTLTVSARPVDPAVASDYTLSDNKILTIAAGATTSTGTVDISAVDNNMNTPDKTVTISATASGGVTTPEDVTLTITDDDDAPTISLTVDADNNASGVQTSIAENGGTKSVKVTATLGDTLFPTSQEITIKIGNAADTATEGIDYTTIDDQTITIPANTASAYVTFTFTPTDDTFHEEDETISIEGELTTINITGTSITLTSDDAQPIMSINSPTVMEGGSEKVELNFIVTLDNPSNEKITVDYADTGTGTATSGADYIAIEPGSFVFKAGETNKTLSVMIRDDFINEDNETIIVRLSSLVGARFADGGNTMDGIGTIKNEDLLPNGWLARFGRTVTEQVLESIASRVSQEHTPGTQVTFAGIGLDLEPRYSEGPDVSATSRSAGLDDENITGIFSTETSSNGIAEFNGDSSNYNQVYNDPSFQSQSMSMQEALLGTSFSVTKARDGGSYSFWGRVSQGSFGGVAASENVDLRLEGKVTTGMLGADQAKGKWLVGIAVAKTSGKGTYSTIGQATRDLATSNTNSIEASLTALIPYVSMKYSERLSLWATLGFGSGKMSFATSPTKIHTADIDWKMAAMGMRGDLITPMDGNGDFSLALTSDAMLTKITSEKTEDLSATDSKVTRFRVGLEGSWHKTLEDGSTLTPNLEVGIRHDGGDAETGIGIEVGGGITWDSPLKGISVGVSGRTLLMHEDKEFKDQGLSLWFTYDPNPETLRGPSVTLRQDFDGNAEGGVDNLFNPTPLEHRTNSEETSRTSIEMAYGLPAFGDNYTGTPHVGADFTDNSRNYKLGWRLTPEATNTPDFELGIVANRNEYGGEAPEHGAGFEIATRW